MVNFVEAYNAGLNLAELAKKSRDEINSVFNDLNQQLLEATEGKISISRMKFREDIKIKESSRFLASLIDPKYYPAIGAENRFVKNSEKELAKWDQDRAGYPCKIILDSTILYCEDKKGLENALAKLLSDPVVGETLYKLQNLPLPEQAGAEATAD